MAIKFQFNKTSLNELNKQLKIRQRALPTLKNKESALRMEVKRAKNRMQELEEHLAKRIKDYEYMVSLWGEFERNLIQIDDVRLGTIKIAGVKIPVLQEVIFSVKEYSVFARPYWYTDGVKILKELAEIGIERDFYHEKMRLLDHARKKTTQKVNLYEKVQIPGYENAIRKIKRFLEDEENLSKSAMKIVKKRYENVEVES
ncbi:MAG: V-type ATP synthase subunit D [Tenuifilum sp.]|uniref:V-type ATP synthase subunit D n=1 Tax=Tenuifilum sp. TaxID=2760880 RepID=UPI001B513BC2|nr:V-type ATP synthase subunit D [Bacteroidales bacterium]HOK60332.1 V-type ATP synthase subunit D [Tenuifilum sp.]MBP9029118.1 V-type ATP synthase subunit D [Bacteroidales bacterium]HOK85226.1 V-type ATP synthase subunit D [Tenuifilum sp.]HON69602.1 V-type ATP synthase subunit D [Tenuifilum sp.]